MSQNYPAPPMTVPAARPATATAGAILALVLTGIGLLGSVVVLVGLSVANGDVDHHAKADATATFSFLFCIAVVGLVAAVMALRNSNGWRVVCVVLGFLVGGVWTINAITVFAGNDSLAVVGGILLLVWAASAIASSVLLLVNGANAFYLGTTPAQVRFGSAAPTAALPPAGWYPVDRSRLRWWDGTNWTEHFHDGRAHD